MTALPVRVLVVEDDISWQQILAEILTDQGLQLDVAGDMAAAQSAIRSESHRLAIVDLSLVEADHNNLDGLQVLEALRRSDPLCRTILLTGFATVELAVKVLKDYGAFTFLRKENFQRAQFRQEVDRALSSAPVTGSALSPGGSPLAASGSGPPGQGGSTDYPVLVVEDDAGWRNILSELILDAGHEVRLCAGFGDALGCLRREKYLLAVIDLALTGPQPWGDSAVKDGSDVSSRPLEGYQLLAKIKERGIPTIVVSGIASMDEIQLAYSEHSIFAYLEKQACDRSNFQRLVREAVSASTHPSELNALSRREREVFELLAQGLTNKEIAAALVVSTNTVKRHLKSIFEKLDVHTRAGAINKGLSGPPPS